MILEIIWFFIAVLAFGAVMNIRRHNEFMQELCSIFRRRELEDLRVRIVGMPDKGAGTPASSTSSPAKQETAPNDSDAEPDAFHKMMKYNKEHEEMQNFMKLGEDMPKVVDDE